MWFLQSASETNADVMFLTETSLNETFFSSEEEEEEEEEVSGRWQCLIHPGTIY